ncbi:helix-turn-helix domain-containing protein [Streptomyces sp. NPDC056883]|uniref:helix-turn-helix domain-containing protein n=1 Tax=Streptomyces sp. NPDC056883 TaxID=3345959 RepID=UPI0036AAED47
MSSGPKGVLVRPSPFTPLDVPDGLWTRSDIEQALQARDVGRLFVFFRRHTGASQTALGCRVGMSQSDVSAIERGLRQVKTVEVLDRIADGLSIPATLLGLAQDDHGQNSDHGKHPDAPAPPAWATRVSDETEEDDVRRRNLMTGALGLGAALITSSPSAEATPSAPPEELLARALFEPAVGRPVALTQLGTSLAAAREEFTTAQYVRLGRRLPHLIAAAEATRDAATGHERERANTIVARAYVLASEVGAKGHSEVAMVAADRALLAARASGDPAPISDAARAVAITMRRAGQSRLAVDFLTRTALTLDAERGLPQADALAARTCLLLTAAYTAATAQRRSTAMDLLDEAEATAARIPRDGRPLGLFVIAASPAECAMYRISTYNALGTPDDGITYARGVVTADLPTAERRARYWTDAARMWHAAGDPVRAYKSLCAVEREAPEEVRRPALRALTTDLLYGSHKLVGIREFAQRTGATAL